MASTDSLTIDVGISALCPIFYPRSISSPTSAHIHECENCRTRIIDHEFRYANYNSFNPCCASPLLRTREHFHLYLRCWACEQAHRHTPQYNLNPEVYCHGCKHPYDGSQIKVWKDETFLLNRRAKTFWDLGELNKWVEGSNIEMKRYGKVCEICGKKFKVRGLKKHMNSCKPSQPEGEHQENEED